MFGSRKPLAQPGGLGLERATANIGQGALCGNSRPRPMTRPVSGHGTGLIDVVRGPTSVRLPRLKISRHWADGRRSQKEEQARKQHGQQGSCSEIVEENERSNQRGAREHEQDASEPSVSIVLCGEYGRDCHRAGHCVRGPQRSSLTGFTRGVPYSRCAHLAVAPDLAIPDL
jgi:hypothetical protein